MANQRIQPMSRRIVIIGLCVAVGGVGVAAWHVQGASPTPQTQPPAPAVPVGAEKVQVSDFPLVRSGIGTVMPYNVVDIHTQVTGTIDKIGFVEGQTVHPGSLIAVRQSGRSRLRSGLLPNEVSNRFRFRPPFARPIV